ncbi:MAG: GGDEF domain-containing protein [Treponema sp.]|nr:GGDEF domain-containing protein [Candidatus Treponema equi]
MEKSGNISIPWSMILEDSIFGHIFKFLIIDLESDSFEVLKDEDDTNCGVEHLSEWFNSFVQKNNVHPDDITAYENFTYLEKIKEHFKKTERYMYIRYRRRTKNGKWKWATMDLFVYPQFPINRNRLLLVVRDIDNDYSRELTHQKNIENNCNTDVLTGLQNRFSYINRCRDFYETNQSVGVIYCDLNGLKTTNDNLGHEEGDKLLKSMADIMISSFRRNECFRIGGDEFVILLADIERENFLFRAYTFDELIEKKSKNFLLACTGCAWCEFGEQLEDTVRRAERMMYDNKKNYHNSIEGKKFTRPS